MAVLPPVPLVGRDHPPALLAIAAALERLATPAVALGLLVWQGVFVATPSTVIVGASVTLLGVTPALRADARRERRRSGHGRKRSRSAG